MAKKHDKENGTAPNKLAGVLKRLADTSGKMDDMAGEILSVLRRHRVASVARFESVAGEAYALNGWQKGGGRPKAGEEVTPVPDAIKAYMSQIRKAYTLKLKVSDFTSMYELRQAVKEKSKTKRKGPAPVRDPELQGVMVSSPDKFNGALFHDAILMWQALDDEGRDEFEKSLERLITRFRKRADNMPKPMPGTEVPASVTLQ